MIRYAEIVPESVVDGLGIRTVAFLQGCPRHCHGCHNEKLISSEGGKIISEVGLAELILSSLSPLHDGITFSGGDPLMQADTLFDTISYIKARKPEINIWVYTGYCYEEVANLPIMNLINVLVDGPFIMAKRNLELAFRGSTNQRIIDVPRTKKVGKITILNLDYTAVAI